MLAFMPLVELECTVIKNYGDIKGLMALEITLEVATLHRSVVTLLET